jgi:hypothetical protein
MRGHTWNRKATSGKPRLEHLEDRTAPATLVESTFNADADGWRIGEFFSNAGDSPPTFMSSGGNPGGFIRTTDSAGVTDWRAPRLAPTWK